MIKQLQIQIEECDKSIYFIKEAKKYAQKNSSLKRLRELTKKYHSARKLRSFIL